MTSWRPRPTPPDLTLLEEGDIVLTFSGAVESWWLALCADVDRDPNDLPYTHAEALYRDFQGHLMLGGVSEGRVRSRRFISALPEFQHIAVYRAQQPEEKRRQAAKLLDQWTHDPQICAAAFDYTLQDVPGRRDAFCCVGFLNEVFRTAGLEAPFTPKPWHPNAAGRHFGTLLGFEFKTLILVDSIEQQPGYQKVLEWKNPLMDPERSVLKEKIVRQSLAWYDAGWCLKTSDHFNIALALAGLPQPVEQLDRTRSQLRLFADDVTRMWQRLQRRGTWKGLDHAQQEALLQAIYAKYRDRYFVRVESAADTNGVPLALGSHTGQRD